MSKTVYEVEMLRRFEDADDLGIATNFVPARILANLEGHDLVSGEPVAKITATGRELLSALDRPSPL